MGDQSAKGACEFLFGISSVEYAASAAAAVGLDLHAARSLRRLFQRAANLFGRRSVASAQDLHAWAYEYEVAGLDAFRSRGVDVVSETELLAKVADASLHVVSKQRRLLWAPRTGPPPGGTFPDGIFKSPVMINGMPVRWVEFKSFYGAASLTRVPQLGGLYTLPRQISAHVAQYGPGAVVFLRGFSADLPVMLQPHIPPPNFVLFVDARALDAAIVERMDAATNRRRSAALQQQLDDALA